MPNALTFLFSWDRRWSQKIPFWVFDSEKWKSYFIHKLGFRVGNVFDEVSAGAKFITGWNALNDFMAGSAGIAKLANTSKKREWSCYIYGNVDFRAIAYNRFLDKKKYPWPTNIEAEKLVADFSVGATIRHPRGHSISYTQVWRSPEWITQLYYHRFGQVMVSIVY